MKRPAVTVALVYTGGLLLAECIQPRLFLLFAITLIVGAGAIGWHRARLWLLWPFVFLIGWTNLVGRTAVLSPHDLRATQGVEPEIVTLRGMLAETPSQRIYMRDDREVSRSLAILQTGQMRHGTNWTPSFGQVLVLTPGRLPDDWFGGQEVEVTGVISLPPGAEAEGLFDYRSYLRRQGIHYQLKAESTNDWIRVSSVTSRPLSDRFLNWAQATLALGLPVEDESIELLWAMTLGWKTGLTNEVYEPFMRSGTMHIFAISGLHIALISGILVAVLRVLRIGRAWCGVLVVPLIWFYTGVTGWQPSAIRSAIMMTIIIGGWSLKRPADLINSLAAAALIILLWDPQQLFGASFQLSFFCVLSMGLLLPPIQSLCDRLLSTDPLLPTELVPLWRRRLEIPLRWLAGPLGTSLAAWLGSLPLTAYYFHLFSPVTLPANLLIVPLSSMALSCNVGSLICGTWLPWVTQLFNHSAWFWMECMIRVSNWASVVPGCYLYIKGPSTFDMLLYYLLLAGIFSGWLIVPKRRARVLIAVACVAVFYLGSWQIERHSAHLAILPANGGLALFIRAPSLAKDLLIDPGTTNSVERVLKPYLRAQGLNHLPTMILTHGDTRHVSAAPLLAELFSVRTVYVSPVRFRSPAYRRALAQFAAIKTPVTKVYRDEKVDGWRILHPEDQHHFPQADDNVLVLLGELYGTRILLVSDLGIKGQHALLARKAELKADIVVTGVATDGEALTDAFLEAIQPQLIVVADSDYPAAERASTQLRARLGEKKVPVLFTRSVGTIRVELQRGTWRLQTSSGLSLKSGDTIKWNDFH